MTRMWFCYELEDGQWLPVVYRSADSTPGLKPDTRRSGLIEVPADCVGGDDEPMFGRLKTRFPLEVADG